MRNIAEVIGVLLYLVFMGLFSVWIGLTIDNKIKKAWKCTTTAKK